MRRQDLGTECRCQISSHLPCNLTACRGNSRRKEQLHLQAALIAATKDRESAQAALAEAKTRQDETAEV